MKCVFSTFLLTVACSTTPSISNEPAPAVDRSALDAAHAAYLEGDFVAVGDQLRRVLEEPALSPLVAENAYELLEQAYAATNGHLPSSVVLPAAVRAMQVSNLKVTYERQAPRFGAMMWVKHTESVQLRGLTLRQLPSGKIWLDRADASTWKTEKRDGGNVEDVVQQEFAAPLPDGVYAVRLDFEGQPPVDAWFIAHGLTPTAVPEIASPSAEAITSESHPEVTWDPFTSPEHVPFEGRTLNLYVGKRDAHATPAQHGYAPFWNLWTPAPGLLGAVRIGAHAGAPPATLTAGDYWLSLSAAETRSFGPVELLRSAQTHRAFHVVAP